MKKLMITLWVALLPVLIMAEGELGSAQEATNATGTMIGTLLFIVVVSIWVLPLVFGTMVYSAQKKKAEQQHEDLGIKGALYALIAIIIGAAASYYIVGTIGGLAKNESGTGSLKEGNAYFLKPLFDQGQGNIKKK